MSAINGALRSKGRKLDPSQRAKIKSPEKVADPFYRSPEWRQMLAYIIKARGRRCEDAEHDPSTPRIGVRIYGDHVRELRDGGAPLDPSNIMLRCASCHTRKTAAARRERLHR